MTVNPLPPHANLAQYKKQARDLAKAFKSADADTMRLIRRYHPRLSGRPNTNDRKTVTDLEIRRAKLSLADAQCVIARAHQFENWSRFVQHIQALTHKASPVAQFEAAVDAIVAGDVITLKR